ncbi:MAG: nuclear transport factor 2 family protein [Candidatus Tectomicrobia bacterium]
MVRRTSQDVHEQADHAWVISEFRTQGKYRDKEIDSAGTETVVLERRDGKWTIVHIHWSSS